MIALLTTLLIGVRFAACLFAVMGLLAWARAPRAISPLERYKSVTWGLFAVATPLQMLPYTLRLLGHPLSPILSRLLNLAGGVTFCACLIAMLATRALIRGISLGRVHRGLLTNLAVFGAFLVATWLTR